MTREISVVDWDSTLMKQALELRHEVFVVEQGVPVELEIDEHDEHAVHFAALQDGELVATMRLLPSGNAMKIGRVAVGKPVRRKGIGTALMMRGIGHAATIGYSAALVDAQVDSMPFYEKLGFEAEGEVFDDAGIPHRRMRLALP